MTRRVVAAAGVLAALVALACTPSPPQPKTDLPPVRASDQVVAEGQVVPARYATLTLPVGGIVAEVAVKEGDEVVRDQPLVRLRSGRQRAALDQAEATLARARTALERARAGPRPEEIAVAEAGLRLAEAGLERLGADPGAVNAQAAALRAVEAEYERLAAGADSAQLVAARARMESAARAVQQAQAVYDQAVWRTDIAASPEALRLEQATNEYTAARAAYEQLVAGPRVTELAAAQARVDQQRAVLDQTARGARPGDRAVAAAEVERARANLELVRAGARAEDIAALEAEVRAAEAAVQSARVALDETELRAPFAGVVAQIDLRVGEQVNPATPLARVADTTSWLVRTTDLTELSVVRVRVGAPVVISVDAIPGLELPGQVTRIGEFGENRQGDITYTVWIAPARGDPRLRWNMTVSVRIDTSGP